MFIEFCTELFETVSVIGCEYACGMNIFLSYVFVFLVFLNLVFPDFNAIKVSLIIFRVCLSHGLRTCMYNLEMYFIIFPCLETSQVFKLQCYSIFLIYITFFHLYKYPK